jgi:hypothetical protein
MGAGVPGAKLNAVAGANGAPPRAQITECARPHLRTTNAEDGPPASDYRQRVTSTGAARNAAKSLPARAGCRQQRHSMLGSARAGTKMPKASAELACHYQLCIQGTEHFACILQISHIEALSEPGIDRRQQISCLGALILTSPQTSEANGGAQFELLARARAQLPYRSGPRLLQHYW